MRQTIERRAQLLGVLVVIALLVVLGRVAGFGVGRNDSAQNDKYHQTWPKSYIATSCSEAVSQMTFKEQWVASADMLYGLWKNGGTDKLPPDATVERFRAAIIQVCGADPSDTIATIAATHVLR